MDFILEILKAVVYGVIEGITEWLPISSTGHMILAEQVLKFQFSDAFMEMFRVVIQLFARHIRWPVMHLWFKIIAACAPAAVLGILLDDWFDAHLYNSVTVAATLILYGVAFILIERRPRPPVTAKLSRINYKQAMTVGAWQVLSLVPGTSRSGATILGGMMCGMSRPCASQFTFFLAIPVMAGASPGGGGGGGWGGVIFCFLGVFCLFFWGWGTRPGGRGPASFVRVPAAQAPVGADSTAPAGAFRRPKTVRPGS